MTRAGAGEGEGEPRRAEVEPEMTPPPPPPREDAEEGEGPPEEEEEEGGPLRLIPGCMGALGFTCGRIGCPVIDGARCIGGGPCCEPPAEGGRCIGGPPCCCCCGGGRCIWPCAERGRCICCCCCCCCAGFAGRGAPFMPVTNVFIHQRVRECSAEQQVVASVSHDAATALHCTWATAHADSSRAPPPALAPPSPCCCDRKHATHVCMLDLCVAVSVSVRT